MSLYLFVCGQKHKVFLDDISNDSPILYHSYRFLFYILQEDEIEARTKRFIRSEAKSKLFLRTELYINKNEKGKN